MIYQLRKLGFTSDALYFASLASIGLSIAIWFLRRNEDNPNAERFGIFVGLWAPTFVAFANALKVSEENRGIIEENRSVIE